jgi:putative ABC transport system substrate-binding protein
MSKNTQWIAARYIARPHEIAARYIDRILKDAKPGELSIEQPTQFHVAVNLGSAIALGLTFPQSLLVRADEKIE